MQSDIWQTILAAAIRALTGAASFLLYAAVARACGPAEFGAFGVLLSAAMMIGIAGSFGQQMFLIREVSQATVAAQHGRLAGAILFSTLVVTLGALASALIFVVAVPAIYQIWQIPVLVAGAAMSFLFAVSQATMGMLRADSRTLFAITSRDLVWRILSFAAVCIIASVVGAGRMDASVALLAVSLSLFPIVVVHIGMVLPKLIGALKAPTPIIAWRQWLNTSLGLAVVGVVASADLYAYMIALGALLPHTETGAFFASMKTVEFLNLFLVAVTLIIAPELAKLISADDPTQLQRRCNSAIAIQSFPAILATALVILIAPLLMWIFDPIYVGSANLLRLLAIGMLINALAGATGLMMQLAGMHWLQVLVQGGSLVLALLALTIVVPIFGLFGAAIVFVVQKLIWNTIAILALRRRLHVDPSLLGIFDNRTGGIGGLKDDLIAQLKWSRG
jgi:O-antigen/teichoic acid export membrane protein